MMHYSIYVLMVLALWHFVYDGILAPSFRLEIRLKLFALRDEVRRTLLANPNARQDSTFNALQDSINTTIRLCASISIVRLSEIIQAVDHDPQLKQKVKDRREALEKCTIDGATSINARCAKLVRTALLVNSGGWFIYILPIVFAVITAQYLWDRIRTAVAIPLKEIERLWPNDNISGMPAAV